MVQNSSLLFLAFQLPVIFSQASPTAPNGCVDIWLRNQPNLINRFRPDQLRFLCDRSNAWKEAALSPVAPVSDFLTPNQVEYIAVLAKCRGSDCLQLIAGSATSSPTFPSHTPQVNTSDMIIDFQPGGFKVVNVTPLSKTTSNGIVVRKEYRQMTDDGRNRYHAAIQHLKTDKIDGISKYDLLVIYHTPQEAPEAHWGPAFLPFHREYLKQFELALRQVDPSLSVPYWDSTLDEGLPNPRDSILWTQEFFGTAEGPVTNGPFAGWSALQVLPSVPGEKRLIRQVGMSPYGGLYKPSDIDFVLSRRRFEDLTSCVDPTFEMAHGLVHSFVGGYMLEVSISPNDPVFFSHHSFIDFLWEKFRQTRQNSQQRRIDYPANQRSCNEFHFADAQMKPFPLKNMDGLSESYTKQLYQYEERPVCREGTTTCVPYSPYLFCDTRRNRCLSKIQPNGNCSGFENQDICYNGTCRNGVCQPSLNSGTGNTASNGWPVAPTAPINQPSPIYHPVYPNPQPQPPPHHPTQPSQPPAGYASPYHPSQPSPIASYPSGGYYYWANSPKPSPSYPTGGYYHGAPPPTPKPYSTPAAYITMTVVKGYGGYGQRADATVTIHGLGSPAGYTDAFQAVVSPSAMAPSYSGACVAKIYDPDQTDQQVKFSATAVDSNGRQCRIRCWDEGLKKYDSCPNDNVFAVSSNQRYRSDPIYYFRTANDALEKRWVETGYRRYRLPDYIIFQCL